MSDGLYFIISLYVTESFFFAKHGTDIDTNNYVGTPFCE
jgi:hypothetical protein